MTPVSEKDDVMHSLEVIQNICLKHIHNCIGCPLYSRRNDGCAVKTDSPCCWKIKYNNDIWRAVE